MAKRTNLRCNAEIGKPGNWHTCMRPARWRRMSKHGSLMCYCNRHKDRAENPKPEHFIPAPLSVMEPI